MRTVRLPLLIVLALGVAAPAIAPALAQPAKPLPKPIVKPVAPPPPSVVPSAAPSAAPSTAGVLSSDDTALTEKARELFKEGSKLFRAEKWAQAEAAFEAAWALTDKRSKSLANNLGQSEMHLGKYREAAEHLCAALRLATPEDKQRPDIERDCVEAKKKVGTLVVTVSVDGAQVLVGDRLIGKAPLIDPLFVEPGKAKVVALLDGYEGAKAELDVAAGQEVKVALELKKPGPTASATATATAAPSATSTTTPLLPAQPNRLPAYIAFGVGAAGLIVGAVAGGAAVAGTDSLSKKCASSGACPKSEQSELSTTVALAHVSTAGIVVAGVGAAVGVTLILLSRNGREAPRAAVQAGPTFIGVKGAF